MKDKDKSENEIVHEFMDHDWTKEQFEWRVGASVPMTLEHLKHYETSWGWLMPVVEKIEGLAGWNFSMLQDGESVIFDDSYKYQAHGKRFAFKGNRLQATYKAVVEFIKWHNQNVRDNG